MERTVVVDVETSGLSVRHGGRVIEFGAVIVECGKIIDEFTTLIDCGAEISYGAYSVHGISQEMLRGQPKPGHAWERILEFVGDAQLVAHNATFDGSFISHEFSLLELSLPNPWSCTLRLSRQKLPQAPNYRLESVYRYLFGKLPMSVKRHRALDDARLASRIWVELMENY